MRFTKPVRFRHDDALTRIPWDEFGRLVATHYREQGYVVEHTGGRAGRHRAEDAMDLTLTRGTTSIIVQCRHWVAQQVPHQDVRQLVNAMPATGASQVIAITSGEFSRSAVEFAERLPHVTLIDGMRIRAILGKVPEPPLPVLLPGGVPPWAEDEDHLRSRAPMVAAVGAVIVMGLMLCVMYGVYIHEIQRAQMQSMQATAAHAATVAMP